MTKPEDAPRLAEWLTATEVASLLGISRQTTNLMIRAGEFESLVKIGPTTKEQFLVRRSEVLEIQKTRTFPRSIPRGT